MPPERLFGLSILLGFLTWGLIVFAYVAPALRRRSRSDALRPLLLLHSFRFIGLAFLVPGVVSPELPDDFARPAAYGDLLAAILAMLSIATLGTRVGIGVVWVFNVCGTADLLFAYYQGRVGVGVEPGQLGATYFIPTVFVPLLLVTHALVFRILLRAEVAPTPR